eukprot:992219-Rhodomonas_salina.1
MEFSPIDWRQPAVRDRGHHVHPQLRNSHNGARRRAAPAMAGVQDMDAGRARHLLGQSRTGTHRPPSHCQRRHEEAVPIYPMDCYEGCPHH